QERGVAVVALRDLLQAHSPISQRAVAELLLAAWAVQAVRGAVLGPLLPGGVPDGRGLRAALPARGRPERAEVPGVVGRRLRVSGSGEVPAALVATVRGPRRAAEPVSRRDDVPARRRKGVGRAGGDRGSGRPGVGDAVSVAGTQ